MGRFVWILDAAVIPHLKGSGGVAPAYILPKGQEPSRPAELAGSTIWMVMRGSKGDILFAHLLVEQVEQFEEGISAGDFLLNVDLANSYKCVKSYESSSSQFLIAELSNLPFGLHEIEEELFIRLTTQSKSAIAVRLQKIPEYILKTISLPQSIGSNDTRAKQILASITSQFTLEEVWANGIPKLPPFANFAYQKIESQYGKDVADGIIGLLAVVDPTILNIKPLGNRPAAGKTPSRPIVDTNLVPIDPEKVYARKFVARSSGTNLMEALEKIEHAEANHQNMLRDVSIRLKQLGYLPLQSSSIDLFVERNAKYITFELKTTNSSNILSQTAKGVFQLACYNAALSEEGYLNSKLVLLINKTECEELNSYAHKITSTLGIITLFYDRANEWPHRVPGLEDILREG